MEDSKLPYFTVRCPVEAIAYPLTDEPYLTQLLPGTYYSVLELTVETLTVGRLDAGPEVYLICFTLADWAHFVLTSNPIISSH
jgi:hypothetical protein